jgi:ABC-type lipoprotein release transport system permease subunit
MNILLLLTITALTVWSLRLMGKAHEQKEFSLMFAGVLVAVAAAGLVAAYSLMLGCMGYLEQPYASVPPVLTTAYNEEIWVPINDGGDAEFREDFQRVSEPRALTLPNS